MTEKGGRGHGGERRLLLSRWRRRDVGSATY